MTRKYLDDIGLTSRFDNNWNSSRPDKRKERFVAQRATYGFDERETWSLKDTLAMYLYERIKMYIEIGGERVDLEYHKFNFKDKSMTQLEILNQILDDLKFYLKGEDNSDGGYPSLQRMFELDNLRRERYHEALELLNLVIEALWW